MQSDIKFNNICFIETNVVIVIKEIVVEIEFTDKRGRTWETFVDVHYYDCICVRIKSDRDFNSPTSFHFMTQEQAKQFVELIKVSS